MRKMASAILCVVVEACRRTNAPERRMFLNFRNETFVDLLNRQDVHHNTVLLSKTETGPWSTLAEHTMHILTMATLFEQKYIRLPCDCPNPNEHHEDPPSQPQTAFNVLMSNARQKSLPPKKASRGGSALNRKDELYNQVIDDLQTRGIGFSAGDSDGPYLVTVLTNALWYITNQHATISSAYHHGRISTNIPVAWDNYQGFDDYKRKKTKCHQLNVTSLKSHADTLFSLCLKPSLNRSVPFTTLKCDIERLAASLQSYVEYLEQQNLDQVKRQRLEHPVRTLSSDCSIQHKNATNAVEDRYLLLDQALKDSSELLPVKFDEAKHLGQPFQSSAQRLRFIENIALSVPVDVVRYCPGGSYTTIVFLIRVQPNRSTNEELTQTTRVMIDLKPKLPEFHTRQMKLNFKRTFSPLLAKVTPSLLEYVYQELSLDASAAQNEEVKTRISLILQGETGLVADMRTLNKGRPGGNFDDYFNKMNEIIEEATAADDRRHNVSHLAEWISIRDLMDKTKERCPPDISVPSKALVRLQFTPRNAYANTALAYTGRFEVQHKIQRRQLRASHPDNHFCAAQLKYLKQLAVSMREIAYLMFVDDKAKLKFGEPGHILSTGVRGKESLAPARSTISAEDHDTHHKGSFTPSVYLDCDVPVNESSSFCRGQVSVFLNDSILEKSCPFRHAAAMIRLIEKQSESNKSVLLKFSDGGTDQRNNLESVRCSLISMFKALDLDMMIVCRCSPGQSWLNTVERVMSILNLALQNCALSREKCSEEMEKVIKNSTDMKVLRQKLEGDPARKQEWTECIAPMREKLCERFRRMSIKDKQIQTESPVTDEQIEFLKQILLDLFPGIDLNQLRKLPLSKVQSYQRWLTEHCRLRQYSFQIRKCRDTDCCGAPRVPLEKLQWLPDPVLADDNLHYKPFVNVYGTETTDNDRPASAKKCKKQKLKEKNTIKAAQLGGAVPDSLDSQICTAQNVRCTVVCIDRKKPRLLFCRNKLTERQNVQVAVALSEYDYTCGSPVFPPGMSNVKGIHIRQNLTCDSPIEISYYSSAIDRVDLCCYCGVEDCTKDAALLKQYKTVLPICKACETEGKTTICQRPYGKH